MEKDARTIPEVQQSITDIVTAMNSIRIEELKQMWVIIGSQTRPYKPPKIEWVREIVEACDKARIPVFLKDNLKPLIKSFNEKVCNECEAGDPCHACGAVMKFRQEFPNGVPKKV